MFELLNKKLTKKGFTLAELLVVVAILAILVAVSIPIFSGKLEQAAVSTDLANMRAAKAAAVVKYLEESSTGGKSYYYDAKNGKVESAIGSIAKYNQSTGKTEAGTESLTEKNSAVVKVTINTSTVSASGTNTGSNDVKTEWVTS